MKNFNSRETYLAARAEWKAEYAELSQQIREARKTYNEAQREFGKTHSAMGGNYNHTLYWAAHKTLETARSNRASLRREATEKINELYLMKEEAALQWEAARVSTCE